MTVLTAIATDPGPRRSRLQQLAFERARHIRHGAGDSPRVAEIERELAEADLLAACDRYLARAGNADERFANRVKSRIHYRLS